MSGREVREKMPEKKNAEQEPKHTVDKGVQDRHGAGRDTSVRVDLLQDWRINTSVLRVPKT